MQGVTQDATAETNTALLLTPPGVAAIAVLRLVGPGVAAFLDAHFTARARPGRTVHGRLVDGDRTIDDPVVVLSEHGQCADLNLHGGPWVVRSALELASRAGFEIQDRLPLPPPDSAVDAEDPLEREVLSHLPLARTELGVRVLLSQPAAWDRLLRDAPIPFEWVNRILQDQCLHWLLHPPTVAIIGAPNVGKSTLANQLYAQDRSITADLPGTTRDWVGEFAHIDGLAVMLVDTPGIRDAADSIEREAIARSAAPLYSADLVVLVLDAARPLSEQAPLLQQHPGALRVINRVDRPPQWNLNDIPAMQTVATTGDGIDVLRSAILEHFMCRDVDVRAPRCWTDRQRALLGDLAGK